MALTEDIFKNGSSLTQESKKDTDYYSGLLDNNWWKNVCLIVSCFGIVASPLILYSITWFERYGNDNKRTLLNMFVSLYCWTVIEFVILVQIPGTARLLIGPLPVFVCQLYAYFRATLIIVMLLYKNASVMTRYIFIFWLKNPAAFQNDFWCRMIAIWVHIFSLIFRGVDYFISTKMSITYYICIGQEPHHTGQPKLNSIMDVVAIFVHIFVHTRIYFYKRSKEAAQNTGGSKYLTVKDMETR
jgi:hypothetical protein